MDGCHMKQCIHHLSDTKAMQEVMERVLVVGCSHNVQKTIQNSFVNLKSFDEIELREHALHQVYELSL